MCPEYNIYHTRFPQDERGFMSDETVQFISLTDIKVSYFLSKSVSNNDYNFVLYTFRIIYHCHRHPIRFVVNVKVNLISMIILVVVVYIVEHGMQHLMIVPI
jgi:hypothetical protein